MKRVDKDGTVWIEARYYSNSFESAKAVAKRHINSSYPPVIRPQHSGYVVIWWEEEFDESEREFHAGIEPEVEPYQANEDDDGPRTLEEAAPEMSDPFYDCNK